MKIQPLQSRTTAYQLARSANGSRALPWLFVVFVVFVMFVMFVALCAALFCRGATPGVMGNEIPAPNPGLLEGMDDPDTEFPDAEANVPNMPLV